MRHSEGDLGRIRGTSWARAAGLWLVIAGACCLLAGPAAGAPKHGPKPLPDPAISAVGIRPNYAFKDESAHTITFCERTTNLGRGPTSRRLHNTMTLIGPGGIERVVSRRDVPKLPGSVHPITPKGATAVHHSHYGCGRGVVAPLTLPPGGYDVEVCADRKLKQRSLANNCARFHKGFFVIKRTWTAALAGNGVGPYGEQDPSEETWQSSGAVFTFDPTKFARVGLFPYTLTGSVSYVDGGSENGCVKHGGGVDVSPTGTLTLDYVNDNYMAIAGVQPGFSYPVTNSCISDPRPGPQNPAFLLVGVGGPPYPLPFGTEQITDRHVANDDQTTWNWSLR